MLTSALNYFFLWTNLWRWDWWFSIEYCVCDAENEGAMKMVEGGRCDEKLNGDCQESKCNSDCQKKHGNLASGHCNGIQDCICRFPC